MGGRLAGAAETLAGRRAGRPQQIARVEALGAGERGAAVGECLGEVQLAGVGALRHALHNTGTTVEHLQRRVRRSMA